MSKEHLGISRSLCAAVFMMWSMQGAAQVLLDGSFAINTVDGPIGPFGPTESVEIRATVRNVSTTQPITICEGPCVGDEYTYSLGGFASIPNGYSYVFGNGGDTSAGFLNGQVAGELQPEEEKIFTFGVFTPQVPLEPGWYPFYVELQVFAATPERPRLATPALGGQWEVLGPDGLIARLLEKVVGVGPGSSLFDKVTFAQAYYAANDLQATCAVLRAFINEVDAQSGKKIDAVLAVELTGDAEQILTALGCG